MAAVDVAAPSPLPSTAAWRSVLIMAIGGITFGYSLAVVPVYLTYDSLNEDCTAYTARDACEASVHTSCIWVDDGGGRCDFDDYRTVNCTLSHGNSDACGEVLNADGDAACTYDYDDDTCERAFGLRALLQGIYAAANVFGGFFGAPVANLVSHKFGFRGGVVLLSMLALIPTIMASVARGVDSIGLMIFARVLMGIMGWGACFLAPLYPTHTQPAATAATIQTSYQVFVDLGLLIAAIYGLALEPRDFSSPTNIELRIHGLHAVQGALAVAWLLIGLCVVPESPFYSKKEGLQHVPTEGGDDREMDAVAAPTPAAVAKTDGGSDLPCGAKARLYLLGATVASALQMTGVGPFVAFAPSIASETGLRPLEGNLLVSFLFVVGAAIGPFVGKRINQRYGYIAGCLSTTIGCVFIAVAVMPGLLGNVDSGRLALSALGILVFSIGFNALSGTFFFVWAQRIFPPALVQSGSSSANTVASIEQMINTFVYPIAVVGISGGLAGDQRVGTAAMFFVYAALGLFFTIMVGFFMHPYGGGGDAEQEKKEKAPPQSREAEMAAAL